MVMSAKTAAWYDSMYNNRALVPDHAQHFALWAESSEQARASHKCQLNIAYGEGPNESLDIFPASRPNAPVVVFIHGGYWRSLDKADHSFVAPPLHDMGACVVVVNYALCPGTPQAPVTIPDIALQMVKAMAWTWHHIAEYGGNPQNVTVAGIQRAGIWPPCCWLVIGSVSIPKFLRIGFKRPCQFLVCTTSHLCAKHLSCKTL
jgi:arylformamidase